MEFLKKHYEKIALAIVSLMMIATVFTLADRMGGEESRLPAIDKNISPAKSLDTNELQQVSVLMKNPPTWGTNDGPRPFIPDIWVWNGKEVFQPTEERPTEVVKGDPADELEWWAASRAFPVKFMSVVTTVGTNKVFAINLPGAGTRFVKIGDPPIRQVIYGTMEEFVVLRYEEKKVEWFNPKVGAKQVRDVSELVLQRKSAGAVKEILLIIGREVLESEPVARYRSNATGEQSPELKRGSKFDYKGNKYEILRLDTSLPILIFKDVKTQKEYKKRPQVVPKF